MTAARKIKICHLTSVHQASDTRIFYKECRSLAAEYDVYLIAPAKGNYIKDDVKVISLKRPKYRIIRFVFTDISLLFKAIKLNAVLYHFHDPELIFVGLFLRALGKIVIYDVHEDVNADIPNKSYLIFKSFLKVIYGFAENLAIRYGFHFVLAEKSYVPNYIHKTRDFIIVQNFVPLKELEPARVPYNEKSYSFALIGYLSARRGLPFIIEALAILKKKRILVKLICIGEINEGVNSILKQSKDWNEVKDNIEFLNYIPFPDCLLVIQNCLAGFALPENIMNHYYSYPTKMFEYLAMGLPVISSDFDLYKNVVEKYECGLTVNPESSSEIANAIEYLLEHPEKAKNFSENAKIAIKNFDWETEETNLRNYYRRILN